jgi:hypothetical protein
VSEVFHVLDGGCIARKQKSLMRTSLTVTAFV